MPPQFNHVVPHRALLINGTNHLLLYCRMNENEGSRGGGLITIHVTNRGCLGIKHEIGRTTLT